MVMTLKKIKLLSYISHSHVYSMISQLFSIKNDLGKKKKKKTTWGPTLNILGLLFGHKVTKINARTLTSRY